MPWRRAGFVRTDFDYAVIKYGLLGDAPRSAPDLRVDRRPRNARRHERPARREVDRHDPEFERSGAHAFRLVAKAFTPPVVERLRPFFRATAERLVDRYRRSLYESDARP